MSKPAPWVPTDPEDRARYEARAAKMHMVEMPILQDLAASGVQVESVFDLVESEDGNPAIVEILLGHLRDGDYPKITCIGMAMAVGRRLDNKSWPKLRELYLNATDERKVDPFAQILARVARKPQLPGLIELVGDESRGSSRILFLPAIRRIGRSEGRAFIESLRDDPTFGKEVKKLLGKAKAS